MVKETLDEKALASMKTILEQLARKKTILPELDAKIVEAIEDPGKTKRRRLKKKSRRYPQR